MLELLLTGNPRADLTVRESAHALGQAVGWIMGGVRDATEDELEEMAGLGSTGPDAILEAAVFENINTDGRPTFIVSRERRPEPPGGEGLMLYINVELVNDRQEARLRSAATGGER